MAARARGVPDAPAESGGMSGSDESLREMIASRRKILDDLMRGIDESQEANEKLQEQIADMEIKVTQAKHTIGQLRTAQERHTVQAIHPVSCPKFHLQTLNAEHQDFVKDMTDRIQELTEEGDRQVEANRYLEKEYVALVGQNKELKNGIRQAKIRIEKQNQEGRDLKDKISQTQRRLQDHEIQLRSNSQTLNITEAAVSGLIERRQELDQNAGGLLELKNKLQQVRDGIASEQTDLDDLNSQMAELRQATDAAMAEMNQEIGQIKEVANWSEESKRILIEIGKVDDELKQIRSENAVNNARYNLMYNRFRQLAPLFKKWGNSDLSAFQPIDTLESLLVQCGRAVKETSAEFGGAAKSLEDKMAQNSTTESLVRKRAEELERAIGLFRIESARLKEQIDARRVGWSEEEHELVTQISNLKVRLAQKQLKK